jgi:hypothetical protein
LIQVLERDCDELEVTPNLEFLVTFGMKLEELCNELDTKYTTKSYLI